MHNSQIVFESAEKVAHPDQNTKESNMTIGRRAYSTSKLCNVLCTYELKRQLEAQGIGNITVNAYDPWMIPGTSLARLIGAHFELIC